MRTLLLLIFFAVALETQAQTNVYHPFPDSNATWCSEWSSGGEPDCNYGWVRSDLGGKTQLNGFTYNRLIRYGITDSYYCMFTTDTFKYTTRDTIIYYIRQDTALKKVWIYDGFKENILYDFNLKIGDTLNSSKVFWSSAGDKIVTSIDSVLIDGNFRKRFNYNGGCNIWSYSDSSMIEGIGSLHGLMEAPSCFEHQDILDQFIQNNKVLFYNFSGLFHRSNSNCPSIVSVKETGSGSTFVNLSPNPFHTSLTLKMSRDRANLTIYNTFGELVQEQRITNQSTVINRNSLADGIYFFQLVNDNGEVARGKFVVN